jgi:hypothetical protein
MVVKFCDMCGFAPVTERIEHNNLIYHTCLECKALAELEGEDEDEW